MAESARGVDRRSRLRCVDLSGQHAVAGIVHRHAPRRDASGCAGRRASGGRVEELLSGARNARDPWRAPAPAQEQPARARPKDAHRGSRCVDRRAGRRRGQLDAPSHGLFGGASAGARATAARAQSARAFEAGVGAVGRALEAFTDGVGTPGRAAGGSGSGPADRGVSRRIRWALHRPRESRRWRPGSAGRPPRSSLDVSNCWSGCSSADFSCPLDQER